MVQRSILLILFVLLVGFTTASAQGDATPKSGDGLKISEVTAANPIRDGVENEFLITIEYDLQRSDEATISIGFNADDPGKYRMATTKKVKRGANTITLRSKVVPKDWKDRGDFFVYVNLSPYPAPTEKYRPIANARRVIDFEP